MEKLHATVTTGIIKNIIIEMKIAEIKNKTFEDMKKEKVKWRCSIC